MTKKHRLLLCILSSLLAFGGFTVCGLSQPAARMLHKWYNGTIWIFMFFFISLMFMALRARLLRSAWVIPLCVLLSFPSASLAYLAYFGLFEPSRLLNALTQVGLFQFTFMLLILSPAISLVWLFGGLAGSLFLIMSRILLKWTPSADWPAKNA
jgi:hypothetical protein